MADGIFEPPAEALAQALNPKEPMTEAATVSIAISLKRIADEICRSGDRDGLTDILSHIEQRLGPTS